MQQCVYWVVASDVESEIMSRVVSNFVAANAPILPVHDSAIVREKDVDKLVERMGQCFLSVVDEYTGSVWANNLSVHMKILFCYKPKTIDF